MDVRDARYAVFEAVEAAPAHELRVSIELASTLKVVEQAVACFRRVGWRVDVFENFRAKTVVVKLDGREREVLGRALLPEPG